MNWSCKQDVGGCAVTGSPLRGMGGGQAQLNATLSLMFCPEFRAGSSIGFGLQGVPRYDCISHSKSYSAVAQPKTSTTSAALFGVGTASAAMVHGDSALSWTPGANPLMSLIRYQEKLTRLVVNASGGRASPHKICMLLAVLDLARAGALPENRIYFSPPLLERYHQLFNTVRTPTDHPNPYFPFFHLAGNLRGGDLSFWHLHALPGRESVLMAMSTARSTADITENIAYADLDAELFELLQEPSAIDSLGETISSHWLGRGLGELRTVAAACAPVSVYERRLRGGLAVQIGEMVPPAYVRDPAFRRVVTQIYDYRCAATGIRVVLPTGEAMVEAAHIHPFSKAGDDDPRNGLALCPNMHWAMDRNLIAPGTDLRWHVSPSLDSRIPDFAVLVALEEKPILLPREGRFAPKREALEWRMDCLRSQLPLHL